MQRNPLTTTLERRASRARPCLTPYDLAMTNTGTNYDAYLYQDGLQKNPEQEAAPD